MPFTFTDGLMGIRLILFGLLIFWFQASTRSIIRSV